MSSQRGESLPGIAVLSSNTHPHLSSRILSPRSVGDPEFATRRNTYLCNNLSIAISFISIE